MIGLLIGHLIGDYLLQNDWMALNKKKFYIPAILHCLVYSLTIVVCSNMFSIYFFLTIFISHFVLDKYDFLVKWFTLIRPATFIKVDDDYKPLAYIIYIVTDNGIHLIGNYYLYQYFIGGV